MQPKVAWAFRKNWRQRLNQIMDLYITPQQVCLNRLRMEQLTVVRLCSLQWREWQMMREQLLITVSERFRQNSRQL